MSVTPTREDFPSFAKALFHGQVLDERILPYPELNSDEQELLRLTSETFQKMRKEIDFEKIEDEKSFVIEVLGRFKELGLFGAIVPEAYGGLGMSNSAYVQLMSELSRLSYSLTVTIGAHQSIGMKALLMFGNAVQKREFLPKLASGEMIAAFGLTEPGAGSDAAGIQTSARLSPDKQHYVLNGSKIWITNGGIADFFTVFAKTPDHVPPGSKKESITAFIVTRNMPGFSSGPEEKKMGLMGSSTVGLSFENVSVPVAHVIGEPGNGFKIAMAVLNNGRIGLASACALGTRKLINTAMEHALQRHQFGKALSEFGLIHSKFANMLMENYAGEAMVRITTAIMDAGKFDYSLESAMCKVFNTEAEWRAANECLQVAGGAGFMKEYGYERTVRDSRIFTIWEGSNEILRMFIGLSGLQGPGEALKEVSKVLKQPMEDVLYSLGVLGDYGVRWFQRKVARTGSIPGLAPELRSEGQTVERYALRLSEVSDLALSRFGRDIVRQQFAIRRVADIATDLFACACALSRASLAREKLGARSQQDLRLAKGFVRKARRRMAENLRRMGRNDDALETEVAEGFFKGGGFPQHSLFSV